MGKPRPWTLLDTERVQDCTVFRVHRDRLRAPWGEPAHPYWRIEADDWVNVVAVTAAAEVVMVRQWRHGTREITLAVERKELNGLCGYGYTSLLSVTPRWVSDNMVRVSTLLSAHQMQRRR